MILSTNNIRFLAILIACLLTAFKLKAQNIVVQGEIVSDSGTVVYDVSVKIINKSSGLLLAYFNTGKTNQFTRTVSINSVDSICITASHVSYRTYTSCKSMTAAGTVKFHIILQPNSKLLDDVKVEAKRIWKSGDTTFFSASAFKEGDERKLRDLILKMPGFEIDENGDLLYKKKRIEKMMIDGEEIFADKIKLIINSIPIHVLQNIQAIENQNENRLMNGIVNENKVFVNLELNKAKLKAAFGDAEGGIGTRSRYYFNPVLFSLYGKLKAGYIGKWNNIGDGIDWREDAEIKNDEIRSAEQWNMQLPSLQVINNFESRWYITNQQSNNHLQINMPFGKAIKAQTEINFINDKRRQSTFLETAILNGADYFLRREDNYITSAPTLLNVRQQVIIPLSKKGELKLSGVYFGNFSKGNIDALYISPIATDTIANEVKNNNNSLQLKADATIRFNDRHAMQVTGSFVRHNFAQNAVGFSNAWSQVYNLAESYRQLQQQFDNRIENASATITDFIKTKKHTYKSALLIRSTSATYQNATGILSTESLPGHTPATLNTTGRASVTNIAVNTGASFGEISTPVTVNATFGYAFGNSGSRFSYPVYELKAEKSYRNLKRLFLSGSVAYKQESLQPYQFRSEVYPVAIANFSRHIANTEPLRSAEFSAGITYSLKNFGSTSLNAFYRKNISGFVAANQLLQFVQVSTDSIADNTGANMYILSNTNIPSIWLKALFHFGGSYSISDQLVDVGNNLAMYKSHFYFAHLTVKKNWKRKYFVVWKNQFSLQDLQLPSGKALSQRFGRFITTMEQRVVIRKNLDASLQVSSYQVNLFTKSSSSFLYAEAQSNYNFNKLPLSITARVGNIFNLVDYRYSSITPFSQSLYRVPIVPRNLFISLRYQL
jgi:hypothetical protein